MSEIFFTSDTHFNHQLLVNLRGFTSIEDHDETLIGAWNSIVTKADVVYHLGDFMLPQSETRARQILSRLNGTKHLICGNHDTNQTKRAKGWQSVADYRTKKILGVRFVMFHYALRTWQAQGKGSVHVYGHSHCNLDANYGRSMDVGVDCSPFWMPWRALSVINWLADIPVYAPDHH